MVTPQFWQPKNSLQLLINDISDNGPEVSVSCFALSKNDSYLISASRRMITLFNLITYKVIAKLKGHLITGLAFSSALNIMVSSGEDTQCGIDKWEKQKCKFLQMPDEKMQVVLSATYIQFHQDQIHFLVVHETQLAIYEAKELKCLLHWTPLGSVSFSQATFSCDSQVVYASFVDGTIFVFDASKLELKCTVGCVIEAYPNAIASHPQKPT
ncbi:hypothetical protein LWI29_030321 [Acer saccharum]|uniref:Uncharacterized protein n=1 Tax=Acer saccharum TaxID=4024 RepID=A0AA39UL86_ACESA|nr:hypothetical protein LWI29_030321 [Acer saccharum]